MKPIDIKVQNFYEQIGIDENPMFMWQYESQADGCVQSAYRIIISESSSHINDEIGTIYDSGKIQSAQQNNICVPLELNSHTNYYFRVCAWDDHDCPCWSSPASFITGICSQTDWKAQWISNGTAKPFYTLKNFTLNEPMSFAYLSISGLGQFKLWINSKKVGNHELDPGWTDYNKQVQYVTFDVAEYLKPGENQILVEVANGWYLGDTSEDRHFYTLNSGYQPFGTVLPLLLQLSMKNENGTETIVTDSSWKTCQSATTLSNVYGSEDFDGVRYEAIWNPFDPQQWTPALILGENEKPKGILCPQAHPPVIIKKAYDSVAVVETSKNVYQFDFGQNMSGLFQISVKGRKGDKIKITPAEKLNEDGVIEPTTNTWSSYILRGTGQTECWRPSFAYSAGRWLQVEGVTLDPNDAEKPYLADVKACFVTSSAQDCGSFSCSDQRYNQIYNIILKAIESNLNHIHSDCPTIEKLGWMETSHLMAPSVMYNKDVDTLWSKIARDARESQYGENEYDTDKSEAAHKYGAGLITSIAPRYAKFIKDYGCGSFWDIVMWGSTIILGPYHQYQFYGNKKVLQDNYSSGKKYVEYLKQKYETYPEIYHKQGSARFICHGLGDWGIRQNDGESRENIETAFFYKDLIVMSEIAKMLELPDDGNSYSEYASKVLQNYNETLLVKNPDSNLWCYRAEDEPNHVKITQANQAIPLYFGMVPDDKVEDVKRSFLHSVEKHQFQAGEVGLRYIFLTLAKYGYNDIVHDMIMQPNHPSYLRFVDQGETTLPEFWRDDARSRNHDMMGHIMEWFYSEVGGISSKDGYRNIKIAPHLPGGLTWVKCSYRAITGEISVDAKLSEDQLLLKIAIPQNTVAQIHIPKVFDSCRIICNCAVVQHELLSYSVSGGEYLFTVSKN